MTPPHADAAPLRVAHLIETDGPGGAERIVADLARTLQGDGVDNVVFVPVNGEGWLARQLEGSGVVIDRFAIDRPLSPRFARQLTGALRRHRVTVAHSHEFTMAVYGAWAAWRAGVPHVITMHGGRYYAGRLRRRVAMRVAAGLSAGIAGVSPTVSRALSRDLWLPRRAVLTIPNGVAGGPAGEVPLRHELGLAPDDRLALAIGNLYPVKGHVHLIDAVARLAGRHPTLHCAIAGRGELADALAARARDHGIGPRVHLLGLRSDVAALLAAADVFVLPSLSEGLPLAVLEAMRAGRPIVASRVGDVASALAEGEAGILVEPGSAIAIADALDTVLRDPERAHALAARAAERARLEYGFPRMAGRYREIYQTVVDRHSAGRVAVATQPPRPMW